jgi:hypothetical protein
VFCAMLFGKISKTIRSIVFPGERGCFRRDFLPCWDAGMESLLVKAIVLTASKIHYGRRTLMRTGVIRLVIGLPDWADLCRRL